MKTYPYPNGRAHPKKLRPQNKKLILFILFILLAVLSFAGSGSGSLVLTFKNPTLETGTSKQDGAVYRFPQVTSDFDALVKIKGRSNGLTYLVTLDMTNTGFDKAFQPQVGYADGSAPSAADWWMDFEITFVKRGTNTVVTIDNFDLTALDIDGNGHKIREYVGFYGLNGYTLEENSILDTSNLTKVVNGVTTVVGKRFDGPTSNFVNIDTSGTSVMVTTRYANVQTFTIRVGGVATAASGASERMYSLYFQDFTYNVPHNVTLPVNLKSFDAKLSSGKAFLNWTASETKFSHYIVERSTDGKNYSDRTMIFATGKEGSDATYSFSENVSNVSDGLVYYRLKMVDIDGSSKYSYVRILRLNSKNSGVTVSAYPNPVQSELRITIPDSWQSQRVVYDMFSASGTMVKRVVNDHASQTETLQLADMYPGTYVIRLSSGSESAIQRIVKSK
ncbi:MAG: T9SS type A sorting domain-containing protein [Chitinophagaceae bacterium]|nr:T9SS type A sorting domain-containing protein [Chitinophagaceae bacterium]